MSADFHLTGVLSRIAHHLFGSTRRSGSLPTFWFL